MYASLSNFGDDSVEYPSISHDKLDREYYAGPYLFVVDNTESLRVLALHRRPDLGHDLWMVVGGG